MANITKAQLLDRVSNGAGVSKSQAEGVIDTFFDTAVSAAKSGDKVSWPGVGSFSGQRRGARKARNPQTGATVSVPAKTVFKFKASSTLDLAKKSTTKKAAAKKSTKRSAAKKSTKRSPAKKATKRSTKKSPAKKSTKRSTKKR